ncbi:AAA family ATPase [Patescibacteria group bacterium]|nr:AAA family ATPase [Patescibacteria group bacterium]
MKLIVIYGPPATGKLTVAQKLAELTNFKIFHNHLTVDLATSVFDFGTPGFNHIKTKFRLDMIEAAAKYKTNTITTFCYAHHEKKENQQFVKNMIKRVKKHKGQVYFVYLFCDIKTMLERVENKSRQQYGKLQSSIKLQNIIKDLDYFTPIPFVDNFIIDNTNLPALNAAKKIEEKFKI